jgi:hypothetical protein
MAKVIWMIYEFDTSLDWKELSDSRPRMEMAIEELLTKVAEFRGKECWHDVLSL